MFCILKKKKICPAYVSKSDYSFNDSQWIKITLHCRKKLSALLTRIISKHQSDFFCLNCLHSFATEKKTSIAFHCIKQLEFNKYQKSDKAPFIIYARIM